jgi:hypothetical protein
MLLLLLFVVVVLAVLLLLLLALQADLGAGSEDDEEDWGGGSNKGDDDDEGSCPALSLFTGKPWGSNPGAIVPVQKATTTSSAPHMTLPSLEIGKCCGPAP